MNQMKLEWTDSHGKTWLVVTKTDGTMYEIPFASNKWIDGMVLQTHATNPPLVKGMMDPNYFLNTIIKDFSTEEQEKIDQEIDKFQASAKEA